MSGDAQCHAVPELIGENRRQFRRKKSLLPATLITGQGSFECQVLDFSEGGAKLACAQSLPEGEGLTLMVEAIGTFSGRVIWRNDGCLGVRFDSEIAKLATSEVIADPPHTSPATELVVSTGTIPAQVSGPLSELLSEIKDLRSDFEQAAQVTGELTTELLFRAYLVFKQALQDGAAAVTLRSEVKRLGLKPSSRSKLQHLAVDIAFPRTKVSPSLRTLYAKAIVGGHSRDYTAQQFREAAETGSSGKGGIKELARLPCNTPRPKPEIAIAEVQLAHSSPEIESPDAILRTEHERPNGSEYDPAISLSENLRERLAREDLADGAEFLVVVRVVGTNALQGVEYLGPCHRASNFPLHEKEWPFIGFDSPAPAK